MRAVLKAQINKTDRNDARGIAQMMRVGLYRPLHAPVHRAMESVGTLIAASFSLGSPPILQDLVFGTTAHISQEPEVIKCANDREAAEEARHFIDGKNMKLPYVVGR